MHPKLGTYTLYKLLIPFLIDLAVNQLQLQGIAEVITYMLIEKEMKRLFATIANTKVSLLQGADFGICKFVSDPLHINQQHLGPGMFTGKVNRGLCHAHCFTNLTRYTRWVY